MIAIGSNKSNYHTIMTTAVPSNVSGFIKMLLFNSIILILIVSNIWVQDVSAIVPVWPHFIKTFRPWFYLCCFMCYL